MKENYDLRHDPADLRHPDPAYTATMEGRDMTTTDTRAAIRAALAIWGRVYAAALDATGSADRAEELTRAYMTDMVRQDGAPRSTFALLDDTQRIVRTYEHTDAERDEYARRHGRRYVYLPLGGTVGDAVEVDDDGEATVVRGAD